jgi:pimeloyl-ACP methyl ester carboxylesterase
MRDYDLTTRPLGQLRTPPAEETATPTKPLEVGFAPRTTPLPAPAQTPKTPKTPKTPETPQSLGQRALAFLRRHKVATAGSLIGATLFANIAGVSPVQVGTTAAPRAVTIELQAGPLGSWPIFTAPCETADSIVVKPYVAADHRRAISAYLEQEQAELARLGVSQKPANRSFALFHEGTAPRGVAVLLHGFNAGTEQWAPLAKEIHARGFDVFVPSLPGHGYVGADGRDDTRFVPRSGTHGEWAAFEDRVLDAVRGSGKVTVVGLSVGGLLSLHLGERHAGDPGADGQPLIRQVISIAPYVELAGNYEVGGVELAAGPVGLRNQRVAELLDLAGCVAGDPIEGFLRDQTVDRQGEHPAINYGSRFVDYDQVIGLEITANEVEKGRAQLERIPRLDVLVTGADDTVDPRAAIALAKSAGANLHVFPKQAGVPHAMIHPLENTNPALLADVHAQILSRLD